MRLIDADAFKKQVAAMCIKNNGSTDTAAALIEWIDLQPTAYDVDKVVHALDMLYLGKPTPYEYDMAIRDAIRVVRKGGVK